MAVTNQSSTEYENQTSVNPDFTEANVSTGKVRIQQITFTQDGAGDATSTVDLIKLPAGKVTLVGALSKLDVSAFGASRTLDVGWGAYTKADGTGVDADPDGLDDGLDVAAASQISLGSELLNGGVKVFDNRKGVKLLGTVAGGTIPDGATIKGFIAYVVE